MSAEPGTVYALVDPRFDAVRYIGATQRPLSTRLSGHHSNPLPQVKPWLAELAELGLQPEIRPLVLDVPASDLSVVEREQIRRHHEAGCVLLNIEGNPGPRLLSVEDCEAFLERSRGLGAHATAVAEQHLADAKDRRERLRQFNAEVREAEQRLYPDDPELQLEALMNLVRLDGDESQLPPEDWDRFCEQLMAVAAALRPYGYSFKSIALGRFFDGVYYEVLMRAKRRGWKPPAREAPTDRTA